MLNIRKKKIQITNTAIKLDDVDGHGRNAIAHVLSYLLKVLGLLIAFTLIIRETVINPLFNFSNIAVG